MVDSRARLSAYRLRYRALIHLFLIPVTNASVNPARSTRPALFAGGAYIAQLWLFWLAPILGAAIAGVVSHWQHDLPDAH